MNGQPDEGERSCCCAMWRRCSQAARGRRGAVSRPLQMGIRRECRPTCSSAFWRPPGIGQRSGKKIGSVTPVPFAVSQHSSLHERRFTRFSLLDSEVLLSAIRHQLSALVSERDTLHERRDTASPGTFHLSRPPVPQRTTLHEIRATLHASRDTAFRSPTNDASRDTNDELQSPSSLGTHQPLLPVKTRVINGSGKSILRRTMA
jgi:hypothetical protein